MRFSHSPKRQGERRRRSGFLFLPRGAKNMAGEWEIRWLERAEWVEEFRLVYTAASPSPPVLEWVSVEWIENDHD